MSNISLPMQPDYYKETMNSMFKQHGINPNLFEGYRVDSGASSSQTTLPAPWQERIRGVFSPTSE